WRWLPAGLLGLPIILISAPFLYFINLYRSKYPELRQSSTLTGILMEPGEFGLFRTALLGGSVFCLWVIVQSMLGVTINRLIEGYKTGGAINEIRLEIMEFNGSVVFVALCAVAMLVTISLMCWRRYPTALVSERGSRKLRTLSWWIAIGLFMGVWLPLIEQLKAAYDLASYLIKGWELIGGSIFLFPLFMGLIGFF